MLISSFTQTYGENRILELMLLKYDRIGNAFRNKCDLIIFSFHNCTEKFIEKGKKILEELYPLNKLIILIYNDISYLQSIRNTIRFLKEKEIFYILQIQDDQHGINSVANIDNIKNIDNIFTFISKK